MVLLQVQRPFAADLIDKCAIPRLFPDFIVIKHHISAIHDQSVSLLNTYYEPKLYTKMELFPDKNFRTLLKHVHKLIHSIRSFNDSLRIEYSPCVG